MSKHVFVQAIFIVLMASGAFAQTSSFTYQGRLTDVGMPPTANYDFEFRLYDEAGTFIAGRQRLNVLVTSGIFTVSLDFGAGEFPGTDRSLEIAVRPSGTGTFTTLAPRQPITSTPYSIKSLNSASADNATQLGGIDSSLFVRQDAGGNVAIAGGLTVAGSLSLNTVNAVTQFSLGGQRILGAGNSNLFVGVGTGASNSGDFNTFVGHSAGNANTTGGANSFFGNTAGISNTTGTSNSYFGAGAGANSLIASGNAFFGALSGLNNTASNNSFFGAFAGQNNTAGGGNVFVGNKAGQANTTGVGNAFFGSSAGFQNTIAGFNSFFGNSSGASNTTGQENTFVGTSSGFANVTGNRNAFFGVAAGAANNADNNAFFGYLVGSENTTGSGNSFFGFTAGYANTTADFNSFFGAVAGGNNTTGEENSFFGDGAGAFNIAGSFNTFVGRQAGLHSQSNSNSFFGHYAGQVTTTGGLNSFFGISAGITNTTGAGNTIIGAGANVGANNLFNATALGANAVVSQSSALVLGSNVSVGIGTSAPKAKLDVTGGNILVGSPGQGIILKSPNGALCRILSMDNAGALVLANVACP